MALTNYGQLKAAIADWLNRSDLTERIPDFIALAEDAIFDVLRAPINENLAQYPDTTSDIGEFIALPSDYQAAKTVTYGDAPLVRISDQKYLTLKARSFVAQPPRYFARLNDKLYFYPPAASAEKVELLYYQSQGPLQTDGQSTKALLEAPGLYLFGSLLQAQAFLIGDQRLSIWQAQYGEVMARNNGDLFIDGEIGGSTMAVGDLDGSTDVTTGSRY